VDDLDEIWVQGRLSTHDTENGVFRAFEKLNYLANILHGHMHALTSEFFLCETVFARKIAARGQENVWHAELLVEETGRFLQPAG
jgi:hypothetical protein